MILGDVCTRSCTFCNIDVGKPMMYDLEEPSRVADSVQKLNLKHAVITSVTRDDVADGGAAIFARTIRQIRRKVADACVEVLIPDFQGNPDALQMVLDARPDILNHNIETVPRLYDLVRPQADYQRSPNLLGQVYRYDSSIPTKSGLMLGFGETPAEIKQTLADLVKENCRILTLGQYLQPSKKHLAVKRYIPPEEFDEWRETALAMGFKEVASGPFVRSSYHARELYQKLGK